MKEERDGLMGTLRGHERTLSNDFVKTSLEEEIVEAFSVAAKLETLCRVSPLRMVC